MPRATATIVFTDLVGSTDLLSGLGEAGFDALRRTHFSALQRAVETTGGEQLKTLGDGMLAVFPSAADAVACAVAVQQAADGQARSGTAPVAVRVGVALGDVSFEDGDVFGAPVVEAARLVAAAGAGQILCTHLVRAVAGGRSGAIFTDAGLLDLKGLPEPVAVCEVAWERLAFEGAPGVVPLPSLLTGTGRIFVGRQEELDRLGRLWKEVSTGERRVALLSGEPGIGKTRLAAEQAARVHADGATVLAGRCDEDLGVPFQPFVEGLRHYVSLAAEPRLGRHAGELARLVPELVQVVPGLPEPLRSDPETERYRLFDAVASWLADVSQETPVLLVLDDLQWAAKPTLLLLRHVLRFSEPIALLVLATYRDTDLGRGHPLTELLADLRRIGGTERIVLAGLDRGSVEAYIEAAAGHDLPVDDEGFARAVFEETDGHPFFVGEVLRHLAESGAIEQRDGRWVTTPAFEAHGIPEGVRDVIGRRLSRLSDAANRVLALACVVGLEFEAEVVRTAGAVDEDDLFSALDEAAAARLVSEVPGVRYRFAHGLVRATLYDELSGARRVSLHRRVAEAIETVHGNHLEDHLPALAHHWAQAAAPAADADRAIEYATRAGDRALAQLAHDEAVSYYGQALELADTADGVPDHARRLDLLLALGEAQRRAGDPAHRDILLEAADLARMRDDPLALARAALSNTRAMFMGNFGHVDPERVKILEAAVAAATDADAPIRARLLATLALESTFGGQGTRHFSLSDQALAIARGSGDPATLAAVLIARYYTIVTPATLPERLANTAELVDIAERVGDPLIRCRATFIRLRCLADVGDVEEAARCLEIGQRLVDELGQPALLWAATWNRVGRLLQAGRIDDAERVAHEALEVGRGCGQPDAALFFAAQMYCIRREQGRLAEVEEMLREAAQQWSGLPFLQICLAQVWCEQGREADARAIFEPFAAGRFAGLPFDLGWTIGMSACADVGIHLVDRASARVMYELLTPYADQMVATAGVTAGTIRHYLGRLAAAVDGFDDAEMHFAAAEATHERLAAPAWLARTRLEWARMLLTRSGPGDTDRARLLLHLALTTATDLSLANVERDVRILLGVADDPGSSG